MNWKKNNISGAEIWTPVPDRFELNDSIDYLENNITQTLNSISIDNIDGLVDYELKYPGNFLFFESPCNLSIKLETKENNDSVPIYSGQILKGKFSKVFITTDSKTEAPVIVHIGKNIILENPENTDLESIESGSLLLSAYPKTFTLKIGHLLKRLVFRDSIISNTSPAKYHNYIEIAGYKYFQGAGQEIFYGFTSPTSGNNNYTLGRGPIGVYQVTPTALLSKTYIEFYNFDAPYSPDYITITLDVSTAGVYSSHNYNIFKQRG